MKEILAYEVEVDENLLEEQFDHSESFFKCKTYGYPKDIESTKITDFLKYEI